MNAEKPVQGFSLLEVIIVMSLIAILATLAIPSNLGRANQKKILETIELVEPYKKNIEAVYRLSGDFPVDNEAAGIPEPHKIVGNYMQSLHIESGAMHIKLGNKLPVNDEWLTIYPVVVEDSPASPISWVCGYNGVPEGMIAVGANKTSIKKMNLPVRCW